MTDAALWLALIALFIVELAALSALADWALCGCGRIHWSKLIRR